MNPRNLFVLRVPQSIRVKAKLIKANWKEYLLEVVGISPGLFHLVISLGLLGGLVLALLTGIVAALQLLEFLKSDQRKLEAEHLPRWMTISLPWAFNIAYMVFVNGLLLQAGPVVTLIFPIGVWVSAWAIYIFSRANEN